MITLSPATQLPEDLLDAVGGFAWWYMDLIDDHGNGAVIIWSWGLPFLPGYASSSRRGRARAARERPSLNVCLYRDGALDFYLLQEFDPEDAVWNGADTWRFGDTSIRSWISEGVRRVEIDLDCAVPGADHRLVGHAWMEGPGRVAGCDERNDPTHDWSPLAGPSQGGLTASTGARNWSFEGRAYHDRNGGNVPMHDQSIDRWVWGRLPFEDLERIYYLVWPANGAPEFLGLEIDRHGHTHRLDDLEVELGAPKRSWPGLRWNKTLNLSHRGTPWVSLEHTSVVDDGPFYMRYQSKAQHEGEECLGFGELVVPDRIDLDRHRPLVKMRVHAVGSNQNSMWLPLFSGAREGRVGRLVSSWLRGNG